MCDRAWYQFTVLYGATWPQCGIECTAALGHAVPATTLFDFFLEKLHPQNGKEVVDD